MDKNLPLVTVGVGSYNNGKYICETLDSIRNQSYREIFLIVVDDFSTDSSVEIIEQWIEKYSPNCMFIKNARNLGISAVGNLMRKNARGKYLSFIASDDCLLPDKVLEQVSEFEKLDDQYAMVYGDTMKIAETGEVLEKSLFASRFGANWNCRSGDIFKNIIEDFFFYTHASLIRIESLNKINFRFDGKYISEDWYMQLKLAQRFRIFGMPVIAAKYRIIPTSMGARFWNAEKIHIVLYSQFMMFNSLFSGEVRNSGRWDELLKKLRYLFLEISRAKNRTRLQLYRMAIIIFFRSHRTADLKNMLAIDLSRKIRAIMRTDLD